MHYVPVHLHPYYREQWGTVEGSCPVAEAAYHEVLTLPLFPQMTEDDVAHVVDSLKRVVHGRVG